MNTTNERPDVEDYFDDWKQRETLVQEMIPVIGKLFNRQNIGIYIYGRPLHNRSVTFIMKSHRFVRQVERNEMSEFESHPVLLALAKLDLCHANIDLGKLTVRFMEHQEAAGHEAKDVDSFVAEELSYLVGNQQSPIAKSQDVVLYGFGRIGRLMARLLIERTSTGEVMRLRAIVVRPGGEGDLIKRASLFTNDSVHGAFQGTLRVDEKRNCLIANGNVIQVIYANSPDKIDYTEYGIEDALIIDNTGKWRDEEGLGCISNPEASASSADSSGQGVEKYRLRHQRSRMLPEDKIVTAASCTTNAIAPVLKVVNDEFGINRGHIRLSRLQRSESYHNYHKGSRRGRSAAAIWSLPKLVLQKQWWR